MIWRNITYNFSSKRTQLFFLCISRISFGSFFYHCSCSSILVSAFSSCCRPVPQPPHLPHKHTPLSQLCGSALKQTDSDTLSRPSPDKLLLLERRKKKNSWYVGYTFHLSHIVGLTHTLPQSEEGIWRLVAPDSPVLSMPACGSPYEFPQYFICPIAACQTFQQAEVMQGTVKITEKLNRYFLFGMPLNCTKQLLNRETTHWHQM